MADPVTELATRLPCSFGILTELSSAWMETVERGQVRALTAARNLTAADLRELLGGGREPLAGTVTVKNAKTRAGWP